MSSVNTPERIKAAALELFAENGFAGTSIGAIETAAGLVPRAGAFYRHFASKRALLEALAREFVTETPDEFDFDGLALFGDTRAELIALARRFEQASERQRPYLRLIEEVRATPAGQAFERDANEAMFAALERWVSSKPAAARLSPDELAALTMSSFGGWLFYLTKRQQGVEFDRVNREALLEDWARHWSGVLDGEPSATTSSARLPVE